MAEKEADMIELTKEQHESLESGETRVRDAESNATYVLVPLEEYERMKEALYEVGPWTDEEMDILAEEAGELLDRVGADV
jgi:hypothetical protein